MKLHYALPSLLPAAAGYVVVIMISREASKSLHASEHITVTSVAIISLCFSDIFVNMNIVKYNVHTPQTKAFLH
ncbi:hypothetical protein BX666DRAFT_1947818 [Dichotomocladium elegans]|nr:hypothetical protein BX666DRAFT_1947818 [Dichotomocladium elegans]